jgi:putative proteasome-type protease
LLMLRGAWGNKLREVFDSIEDPVWNGGQTNSPIKANSARSKTLRKICTPQDKLI